MNPEAKRERSQDHYQCCGILSLRTLMVTLSLGYRHLTVLAERGMFVGCVNKDLAIRTVACAQA